MNLSKEAVDAYKELLSNPKKNNLPIEPITDVLVKSDTVIAQHNLFKQYLSYLNSKLPNADLPKVIFYILLEEIFGPCTGKDETGCAGYHLKLNPVE
jgi:hypothetical protein